MHTWSWHVIRSIRNYFDEMKPPISFSECGEYCWSDDDDDSYYQSHNIPSSDIVVSLLLQLAVVMAGTDVACFCFKSYLIRHNLPEKWFVTCANSKAPKNDFSIWSLIVIYYIEFFGTIQQMLLSLEWTSPQLYFMSLYRVTVHFVDICIRLIWNASDYAVSPYGWA